MKDILVQTLAKIVLPVQKWAVLKLLSKETKQKNNNMCFCDLPKVFETIGSAFWKWPTPMISQTALVKRRFDVQLWIQLSDLNHR